MSGDVFNYVADRVFGTNLSGLNGKSSGDTISLPLSEYERGNKAIEERNALFEQNQKLLEELKKVNSKLESALSDVRGSDTAIENIFKLVGNEEAKISAEKKGDYFVRTQFYSLAKRFGFADNVNIDFVRKNLNLQQKFSFNVYMIAAADYMMLQNYLATLVAALGEVISEAKDSPDSPFFGHTSFIDKLQMVKTALTNDLVNVSRVDSNTFKDFHKKRVQVLASSVKFHSGTDEIDPASVPSISAGLIDDTLNQMHAIHAIKGRIKDEEVTESLDVSSIDTLIPSAYHVSKFNIKGWTL